MNDNSPHPARSAEFLSRLHDGELTPAERAHFESHRAHCPECRRAAAEFEAALSMFRASRTSPAPSDLSARILRRLQSATPRRQRFGIVHGINLKWAAGFAVAIVAAVIGFSVVAQREAARRMASADDPAIPVLLHKGETPPAAPPKTAELRNAPATSGQAAAEKKPEGSFAPDAPEARTAPEAAAPRPGLAAEQKLEKRPRSSSRESREMSADTTDSAAVRQKEALTMRAEAAGGEGGTASSIASAEPGAPARLVIQALDGEGNAPAVLNANAPEMLSELRGRRYVLLVEASGRVREARLDQPRPPAMSSKAQAAVETPRAPQAVRNLRFTSGDRPRRLLLRVE